MFSLTTLPSRRLARTVLVMHLLAVLAIGLADLEAWIQMALIGVVLASLVTHRPNQAVRLQCGDDGALALHDGAEWHVVTLRADTFVSPHLTVLRHVEEGARRPRSTLILGDSLPADDYRRLRVWLKWRAKPASRA